MFRNDMKYRYISINFKFNTDISCSAHVFSTGLEWVFPQLLQTIDLKKAEVSGSQIFFKIGVLKNFILFTRKHLCWGPEGKRSVTL